jgi:hypothetical protein
MLDYFEVKEIVDIWANNDDDWDVIDYDENEKFHQMIDKFESLGFENLDTDFIQEILTEKLRDKYHQYSEDEILQESYEHTQFIEDIVYSEMEEEDFD